MATRITGICLILLLANTARAQCVGVTITPPVDVTLINQLGLSLTSLEQQIGDELCTAFSLLKPQQFLSDLADAQVFANKGIGVDYASNPTVFVLGGAVNLSVVKGDTTLEQADVDLPISGAAASVSIMAGLNLDLIGIDWLTLYTNFFQYSTTIEQVQLTLRNFGIHAQAKFFRPEGNALQMLFQWGGLDITTGFAYAFLGAELKQSLDTNFPLSFGGQSIDATFTSTGTLNVGMTALTIPIELSTNFRVLYILTVFGGLGFDFQFGGVDMDINLDGTASANNPLGGSQIDLGDVNIRATEKGKPTVGKARFFAGLQVNIWMVKIFVQTNLLPSRAFSVALGARIAW